MKSNFYLFNKTYIGDFKRTLNLCKSIQLFNCDSIPLYISAPSADLEYFKNNIHQPKNINWVSDESIISAASHENVTRYKLTDGYISQQIVKSQFWRLFDSEITYLCIDSESQFIKNFYLSDFLNGDNPYTIFHQNKELLQLAANKRIDKVPLHFFKESNLLKNIFNRTGPDYDFGPTPAIWSSKVWKSLDQNYLRPNNMTFWDAIEKVPSELRWYGETLLAYKAIPLYPIEPIFRVYHYDWQFFSNRRLGETVGSLAVNYLGILKQSNWDYQSDYGHQANRKSFLSKFLRSIKRFLARYR